MKTAAVKRSLPGFAGVLVMMAFAASARAGTVVVDGITWTFTVSGAEAAVGGGYGTESQTAVPRATTGDVVIPSVLNGFPVTSVSAYAFYNCAGITGVTVPDSVTNISTTAFSGCTGLVKVKLGDGLRYLGAQVFKGCSSLESVTFGSGLVEVCDFAFQSCTSLKSAIFKEGLERIGFRAFYDCSALTDVRLPDSLTGIDSEAFWGCRCYDFESVAGASLVDGWVVGCDSVSNLDLTGVRGVVYHALWDRSYLRSVVIPEASIKGLDDHLFGRCSNLEQATIHQSSCTNAMSGLFYLCPVRDIIIADGVTTIGPIGCRDVTRITIPASVTTLKTGAFADCRDLAEVTLPDSVVSIGDSAFSGCSGLLRISMGAGVRSIGDKAFYRCSSLTDATIPKSVTSIGLAAFAGCDKLSFAVEEGASYRVESGFLLSKDGTTLVAAPSATATAVIPDGVVSIGDGAFYEFGGMTGVSIPASVVRIGNEAFHDCSGLSRLDIPAAVTSIGDGAFAGCSGLTRVKLPDGVTRIGKSVFSNCTALEGVELPAGVTRIGEHAFEGCSGLAGVDLPAGLTWIGTGAFEGCSGLTGVDLPAGLTFIGASAFEGCSGLVGITIPDGVTEIAGDTFSCCFGLESVEMPDGIHSIGSYAFLSCTGLVHVTIPVGVTRIGVGAFMGCSGLENLTIPHNVGIIREYAFERCSSLAFIKMEGDCPSLPAFSVLDGAGNGVYPAFWGVPISCVARLPYGNETYECVYGKWQGLEVEYYGRPQWPVIYNNLMGAANPNPATYEEGVPFEFAPLDNLEDYSFAGWYPAGISEDMRGTQFVTARWKERKCVLEIEDGILKGVIPNESTEIVIPDGVTGIASRAFSSPFYEFSGVKSVKIPNSVSTIGAYAFEGCSGLEKITIPMGVTRIEDGTFSCCTNLVSVNMPDSVCSIGIVAFYGCSALNDINIGRGVTNIGVEAFDSCTGATSVTIPSSVAEIGEMAFYGCANVKSVTIPLSLCASSGALQQLLPLAFQAIERVVISDVDADVDIHADAFAGCASIAEVTMPGELDGAVDLPRLFADCPEVPVVRYSEPVCFDANGGEGGGTIRRERGAAVLFLPVPERQDAAFEGWFTERNGGERVSASDIVTGPVTFYAHWRMVYEVTFDANGGKGGKTVLLDPGSALGDLPVPTRKGYAFDGWFTAAEGGDAVSADTEVLGSVTFYAHWSQRCDFNMSDGVLNGVALNGETQVAIPDGVTSIAKWAFKGCDSLAGVVIPASVNGIGTYAFSGCSGLEAITFCGNAPSVGNFAFAGVPSSCVVSVPKGSTGWGVGIPGTWNGLQIQYTPCPHDGTTSVSGVKSATCEQAGYTGDEVCDLCGDVLVSGSTIPALGHVTSLHDAKPATCTEAGYSGDEICEVCSKTVTAGSVLPAKGHVTAVYNARPATCTKAGYTGDEICGVCGDVVVSGSVLPAFGHNGVLQGAVAVTCTEDGYTGDVVCTICSATLEQGQAIAAPGHRMELQNAKAATCTADGYTGDLVCTACGYEESHGNAISAFGHDLEDGVVAREPTYSDPGEMVYHCRRCGQDLVEAIPVLPADLILIDVDDVYAADETGSFHLQVSVASATTPKIAVAGLPSGIKFDSKSMTISGMAAKPGVYAVKISVTNAAVKKPVVATFALVVPNFTDDEIKVDDVYGPFVPGVSCAIGVPAAAGCSVSGLPSGLKWTAKDIVDSRTKTVSVPANSVYGAATKPGTNTVTFAKTVNKVKHVATATFIVGPMPVLAIDVVGKGKVTGAKAYAANAKAALKATPEKGHVFQGWYEDGTNLLSQAASYTYIMPATDAAITARFITLAEDMEDVSATIGDLPAFADNGAERSVGVMAGVYVSWPVAVSSKTLATVKVSGLPAGLKFTAKDIVDSKTKAVTVPANTIYGAPSAASKVDAKTGMPKPSVVKIALTTAGKANFLYTLNLTVDPIQPWAAGTFNGGSVDGMSTLTVAATGKISGKHLADGLTWTLSAARFDGYDGARYFATVSAKSGRTVRELSLVINSEVADCDAVLLDNSPVDAGALADIDLFQTFWSTKEGKAAAKPFANKTLRLEGDDYAIDLKFAATGAVAAKATFVTGYDEKKQKDVVYTASCSSVLIPQGGVDYCLYVYCPPKPSSKFNGHSERVSLSWNGDGFTLK